MAKWCNGKIGDIAAGPHRDRGPVLRGSRLLLHNIRGGQKIPKKTPAHLELGRIGPVLSLKGKQISLAIFLCEQISFVD